MMKSSFARSKTQRRDTRFTPTADPLEGRALMAHLSANQIAANAAITAAESATRATIQADIASIRVDIVTIRQAFSNQIAYDQASLKLPSSTYNGSSVGGAVLYGSVDPATTRTDIKILKTLEAAALGEENAALKNLNQLDRLAINDARQAIKVVSHTNIGPNDIGTVAGAIGIAEGPAGSLATTANAQAMGAASTSAGIETAYLGTATPGVYSTYPAQSVLGLFP